MCQANPGPRCANHTAKQVSHYTETLVSLEKDFSSLLSDNKGDKNARQIEAIATRINKITHKRSVAQMDYDGTPTGAKELQAKIDSATGALRTELSLRQRKASMLRAWRVNAIKRGAGGTDAYFQRAVI